MSTLSDSDIETPPIRDLETEDDFSRLDGLHRAAMDGQAFAVRRELRMGADISAKDADGLTALHLAARNGHHDVVKLLLEQSADISIKDKDGWPPLFWAVGHGRLDMVQLLLDSGADISSKDPHGITALHTAAITGQEQAVRFLLDSGDEIETKDRFGWTALHRACSNGHIAVVKLLLERGADITAKTEQGSTALHLSAETGMLDAVQLLLENGADISARATDGWPSLHRAAESGQVAAGLLLLENGTDISAVDDHRATALHRAVSGGHKAMAEMLLDKGIDITSTDANGLTAFHVCAGKGNLILMQLLLEKGADIDARDNINGWSSLHLAASRGDQDVVRFLVEKGGNVNLKDDAHGWTALYLAAASGDEAVLNLLLEGGGDIFAEDKEGCTVLTSAIQMDNKKIVRAFLEIIPGGQDMAIEFDATSRKGDTLDLEHHLVTQDMRLHQLCEACSKITLLSLHEKQQCKLVGCRYNLSESLTDMRPFNTERLEEHSLEYHHHPNLDALRDSGKNGCHLCSLMAFGLQHSYELLSIVGRESYFLGIEASNYGPTQGPGVALVYHRSTKWQQKEELEIFCGDHFTVLPITNVPSKRCTEEGFSTGGALTDDGKSNITAMFYARCVSPNHPVWGHGNFHEMDGRILDHYPRIQSYMPGQIIAVYAIRGRQWLAEFVYGIPAAIPAHRGEHATWGWVNSADFVKLQKEPHVSCDCGKGVWEPPLLSMFGSGQNAYIAVDPLSEDVFSTISTWISTCADKHKLCFVSDSNYLPLRAIDVGVPGDEGSFPDPYLSIGTERQGQYATLSYRWGDGLTFITTSFTIDPFKDGIPLESMPQTFQDAIYVTRRLGLRYLWIDALCILQDSPQDWVAQSAIMDQIYCNAWLNISASGAVDTWSGFLKHRNILETQSCRHPSLFGCRSENAAANVGKVVCPNIPRHDRILNRDVLNTRGWILQERALSKRTLHFGPHEIYWECLSRSASEREPEMFELWSNASSFDAESQRRRKDWNVIRNGIQYLQNQDNEELLDLLGPEGLSFPCHDEEHERWILRNLSRSPKDRRTVQFPCSHYHEQPIYAAANVTVGQFLAAHHLWYLLVEEYAIRSLTRPTDRLPAISGLARIFQDTFGSSSEYVAGIWSGDLLSGLLWSPRVQMHLENCDEKELAVAESQISCCQAPSFSWASYDGPVRFHVMQRDRLSPERSYSAEILSFNSVPTSLNTLGEVSGGSIKLRARAIPLHQLLTDTNRHLRYSPLEIRSLKVSDTRILCVNIRNISHGYLGEHPSASRQCLLLLPLDHGQDIYRRVGYLSVPIPEPPRQVLHDEVEVFKDLEISETVVDYNKSPYEGWEEKEITIV